ncbi:ankyrin repeat-containing domain protein [Aspergillus heterothallicus]
MFNPHDYTVGWICALDTEYVAAQVFLDEEHAVPEYVSPNDNNNYTLGRIKQHNVVIAVLPHAEYGLATAASVARDMLHSFPNVRIGLMVGIGGGAPSARNDIRLGDVVVSSSLFQYDAGKAIQGQEFEFTKLMDQPPTVLRTAVSGLAAQYKRFGHSLHSTIDEVLQKYPRMKREFGRPNRATDVLYKPGISHALHCGSSCNPHPSALVSRSDRSLRDDDPVIHYGLIASANTLMKDASLRDTLSTGRNILCFEMEAVGLMNHFPCLVVRGICDYSDSHKNKDWQGYAAMTAAAYAKDLLCRIPPTRVEAEQKISELSASITESLSRTEAKVSTISAKLESQEDRGILEWLSSDDYSAQQADFIGRREVGTGQWLFDAPEYQSWIHNKSEILFCPGIPGAGKTILAATVVDYLQRKYHGVQDTGIAYIYLNYKRHGAQKAGDLYGNLLKQLAATQTTLFKGIRELYDTHKALNKRPSSESLMVVLQDLVGSYSRVFFVIDALDECQVTDGCRENFLSGLFKLRSKSNANMFFTSRAIPDIFEHFSGCPRLEIRARNEDIQIYIDGRIAKSGSALLSTHHNAIKDKITNVVDGMFLLAQLHYDTISTRKTLRQIKDTLQALPNGPKAYDEAYDEAMKRIVSSDAGSADIATKVMIWITFAKRPLTLMELQHALAVMLGDRFLDEENILPVEDMVSTCAGLVTVDRESSIIRLVHYTTQEYLQRTQQQWFPNGEVVVSQHCLTYLLFDDFKQGPCTSDRQFEGRLLAHALYDYAARNWGHHARTADTPEVETLSLALLENNQKRSAASQAAMVSGTARGYSQNVPGDSTAFHLAAYFGLARAVVALLQKGLPPDVKDSFQQTPLLLAASNGHDSVVSLLLASGDSDVNSKDKDGMTPVSWAAANGHILAVKQLMEEPTLNVAYIDDHNQSPADWATANGHEDVAQLIRVRTRGHVPTPQATTNNSDLLIRAAKRGNKAAVKLLLRDIDVNITDSFGRTALLWAARNGHDLVVQILLMAADTICDWRDLAGASALELAVTYGRDGVLRLLLQDGRIDPNMVSRGLAPLHEAVLEGDEKVVDILLQHGVLPNTVDTNGRTALWYAAREGNCAIASMLMNSKGIKLNRADNAGVPPVLVAAKMGHMDILWCLLDRGVKTQPDDCSGIRGYGYAIYLLELSSSNTSINKSKALKVLYRAIGKGHVSVIEFVLSHDVQARIGQEPVARSPGVVNRLVKDMIGPREFLTEDDHSRLVRLACYRGRTDVLELFAFFKAHLDFVDEMGLTPLSWAARNGHYSLVKFLVKNGAPLDEQASGHQSDDGPLRVEDNGSDTDSASEIGSYNDSDFDSDFDDDTEDCEVRIEETEMHRRNLRDLETLKKMDLHQVPVRGPLSWAAKNGHTRVVRFLLENGADIESVDSWGNRPLFCAIRSQSHQTVRMLLEHGADITSVNGKNESPLLYAARTAFPHIVQLLIQSGADINATHPLSGDTPLDVCIYYRDSASAEILLHEGATVRARHDLVYNPFHAVISADDQELAELLLAHGADIDTRNAFDETILMKAADYGSRHMVLLLLDKGANIEACNLQGTPLLYAARSGHTAVVQLLLERGAKFGPLEACKSGAKSKPSCSKLWSNFSGWSALMVACYHGQASTVKLLIDFGADVELEAVEWSFNRRDESPLTPAVLAARGGNFLIVQLLVEQMPQDTTRQRTLQSVLFEAIARNDLLFPGHIFFSSVDLEARGTKFDFTALHFAVWMKLPQMLKLLLENGADIQAVTGDSYPGPLPHGLKLRGQPPLSIAVQGNWLEGVDMLVQRGARLNATDQQGRTPLHWAVQQGSVEMVRHLISHGANPHQEDNHGRSAKDVAHQLGWRWIGSELDMPPRRWKFPSIINPDPTSREIYRVQSIRFPQLEIGRPG